jgi:predicted nuclease with TOPRIM domain
MPQSENNAVNQRIAELEAENARLRQTLEAVKAERKELCERLYGPFSQQGSMSEEELIEFIKNRNPGDGTRFFSELGLLPGTGK